MSNTIEKLTHENRYRKLRNGFSEYSTGGDQGCYYSSKGNALNAFDGYLQGHNLFFSRDDCMQMPGDEGDRLFTIENEFNRVVGYAKLMWYRMSSGRYEICGYIT